MELRVLKADEHYNELKIAYKQLEQENQNFRDSLYYASSVQQGLMPQARHFKKLGNPYFILYQPARIIGGDFFWLGKKGDWTYYAVGDCTGHSLSGAMLSSLAIGFLNYLVYSKEFMLVGEILNELDKKWMETFTHDEDEEINNDWLEISLIAYNRVTRRFQFTSAKRKAYVSGISGLQSLSGNNYPIGGWQIETNRKFDTYEAELERPFKVYQFSDGYQDQFGGEKHKRFGANRLATLIHDIQHLDMESQLEKVQNSFTNWKGKAEQTDDVCLLGVEFN